MNATENMVPSPPDGTALERVLRHLQAGRLGGAQVATWAVQAQRETEWRELCAAIDAVKVPDPQPAAPRCAARQRGRTTRAARRGHRVRRSTPSSGDDGGGGDGGPAAAHRPAGTAVGR